MSLPAAHPALRERLLEVLPESCLGTLPAQPLSLRINPLRNDPRSTRDELLAAGVALDEVAGLSLAFTTSATLAQVQDTAAWREGRIHVQSLSSIAASLCLAPRPGESVLDLCAAPGSKTTHLASLMGNRGTLVAVDSSRQRLFRLKEVLRLLGATAHCICAHGEQWARGQREAFDRVLVDAPCSAEGRILAGDEAAAIGWSPGKVRRLAAQQKALLHAGLAALKPGGHLLYSTCTFAPEENELVVARALEHFQGRIALAPLPAPPPCAQEALTCFRGRSLPQELRHARRVVPPQDGFFLALLRKSASPQSQSTDAGTNASEGKVPSGPPGVRGIGHGHAHP